jgi:phosphatidylserine/phosphatidylglycerophosphate/cardiolipin synthase-like enzyme
MVQPEDGVAALVAHLDGARATIDIAMYQLDPAYRPIREALQRAVQRGVTVRVLLSRQIYPPGPNTNPADVRALRRLGVDARLSRPDFSYSHWKSILIDVGREGQKALVCDFNIAAGYFGLSPEYPKEGATRGMALEDVSADDIEEIRQTFDADWPPYSQWPQPQRPNLVWAPSAERFSPQGNAQDTLTALVGDAQSSIDMYVQEFPLPAVILQPLLDRARSGVAVRLVGNDGGIDADALSQLEQAGVRVVYGPEDPSGDGRRMYIHCKSIIVDAGTDEAVAFVGSENAAVDESLRTERELGALATDPDSVARIEQTFQRDFRSGRPA